ncbi:MAG: cupin domain-containing protein [Candidatus Hydrogenedentes bacterium]|nr:cupin domain-containing protein [Candidatus Hydrogenedentota bacterium]
MIRRHEDMECEVRDQMRGGTGSVTIRHMFKEQDFGAKIRFCAFITIPPAASIGLHQHQQEDEVYIVLSGTGIIEDGAERSRIKEGDAILTGKGASHAVLNDGTENLHMAAVIACY